MGKARATCRRAATAVRGFLRRPRVRTVIKFVITFTFG